MDRLLVPVTTRLSSYQTVVLSCSHLARRWAALERSSSWLVVDTQVKACSEKPTVLAGHLKIRTQGLSNITHTHHCYQQWSRYTLLNTAHCGVALGS